jgi:capsid protein
LPGAIADAVSKQIASGALPAESTVALESFGYDQETVKRIEQDRRKANAGGLVAGLAQLAAARTQPAVTNADDAATPAVPTG